MINLMESHKYIDIFQLFLYIFLCFVCFIYISLIALYLKGTGIFSLLNLKLFI